MPGLKQKRDFYSSLLHRGYPKEAETEAPAELNEHFLKNILQTGCCYGAKIQI